MMIKTWLMLCFAGLIQAKNVLILLGDDVGFQFGAYGNTKIKSPNVDALAKRSLLFKNGFTSVSSCSPSRSVVLSGLPVHQNGMYGLHHSFQHFQSFDDVRSLPVILDKHNIRTGIVGKKHVGPDTVYKFDYEVTEEHYNLNQVGRNITCMKEYIRKFLQDSKNDSRPFLLYIGIHDIHRCYPYIGGKLGNFCDKFGDGMTPGTGYIKDWKPIVYKPEDVEVPYFLPDTPATREDLAAMYKTYSRFDQGVGLFMKELEDAGFADDTLVIFTSDNGIPFPFAKTNLYDPGQGEPFMVSSPYHKETWGKKTDAMASTMDIVPTVLDWFDIKYPKYKMNSKQVSLTGKSVLNALKPHVPPGPFDRVFSSHVFHEITMYYPMRVIRTKDTKLIHNLNFRAPYGLATDLYQNPTFLDILNRTESGQPTKWFTTLQKYYYRDEWQLFNLTSDPHEQKNLAGSAEYKNVFKSLKKTLNQWLLDTNDPWRCLPDEELEENGVCYPMDNRKFSDMQVNVLR
ncbi:N-sulphoglucosamine sulphohydrolase-like isoform X1 [Mercenaria mercenaria]|uniref:N-sulphoglucosamine sulphohydrolase-like isoform X1 n=1 Tax=Mercenaria mercenaria TaxID=6596 RepID=UPI00234E623B|nr:N-sulphoglucosamine sulphohydrolase-like isoform X1 [Mercenaria mercenaria]XP_053394955.1 N-sulphoglucosamine sulphohydrolase-like isoform X1 [Mercenaria mercenaria]